MSSEAADSTIDNLLQGQSVMLATNHLIAILVVVFVAAALIIWLAPRPTRAVDMTQAGH